MRGISLEGLKQIRDRKQRSLEFFIERMTTACTFEKTRVRYMIEIEQLDTLIAIVEYQDNWV